MKCYLIQTVIFGMEFYETKIHKTIILLIIRIHRKYIRQHQNVNRNSILSKTYYCNNVQNVTISKIKYRCNYLMNYQSLVHRFSNSDTRNIFE